MTRKEKRLLLIDLCGRLPYRVNILTKDNDKGYIIGVDDTENGMFEIHIIEDGDSYTCDKSIENFKPYLRSLGSMTKEEQKEYEYFIFTEYHEWDGHSTHTEYVETDAVERYVTWLNRKGFDYRGLIPMGLALEAPKDMYKTE